MKFFRLLHDNILDMLYTRGMSLIKILFKLFTVFSFIFITGCLTQNTVNTPPSSRQIENQNYTLEATIFADFMPIAIPCEGDEPLTPTTRTRRVQIAFRQTFDLDSTLSSDKVTPEYCEIHVNGELQETLTTFKKTESGFDAQADLSYLASVGNVYDADGNLVKSDTVSLTFYGTLNGESVTLTSTPKLELLY